VSSQAWRDAANRATDAANQAADEREREGQGAPPAEAPPKAIARREKPEDVVPFEPEHMGHMWRLAGQLSSTTLIPRDLQRNQGNTFLVLLRGRELGMTPTQALGAINVIEGKVVESAQLMIALVLKSAPCEYFYCDSSSEEHATWVCRRREWPEGKESKTTFTIADAKRAGLYDKGKNPRMNNWHKWPEEMCSWRAASKLAKRCFPEVVLGMDAADADEIRGTVRDVTTPDVSAPPPVRSDVEADDELGAEVRRLESAISLASSQEELGELLVDLTRLPRDEQDRLQKLASSRWELLEGQEELP
jgi:hypothetical protein